MARNEGLDGLCQRYDLDSYRLAAEADGNELAATALRGLADQAIDLGHLPVAVRLLKAAQKAIENPPVKPGESWAATTVAADGPTRPGWSTPGWAI
ncbi:hypothetical protein [Streptomyces sp. SID12501]|uniref:hypothetical protein n=1 Tax=Streptomyces sp. SID12501 TaxID=2706042 RepID=UPI0031BA5986